MRLCVMTSCALLAAAGAVANAECFTFQVQDADPNSITRDTTLQSNLGPWNDEPIMYTFTGVTLRMALLRFPSFIGTDPGQVPPGTTIDSAILRLKTGDEAGATVDLHRMLIDWLHTWTYNSPEYGGNGVSPDDIEAASAVSATVAALGPQTTYDIDVTADVQAWVDGTAENYGWLIQGDTSVRVDFHTSEAILPADRPELLINCAAATCDGDVDGNGVVDVNDITFIVPRLGMAGPDGDADGSGTVDVNDITYVVIRLGDPCT